MLRRRRPPTHETVAIRHFDQRQSLRIENGILSNDSVDRQKIGCYSVRFVVRQGSRRLNWHGTSGVVENGGLR